MKKIDYRGSQDMRTNWMFWDDMAVIGGVILKGRQMVTLESLQKQALEQLHINYMQIDKTKLLACESLYWIGMNMDIENHIKIALCGLIFSKCSQRKK